MQIQYDGQIQEAPSLRADMVISVTGLVWLSAIKLAIQLVLLNTAGLPARCRGALQPLRAFNRATHQSCHTVH